MQAMHATHAVQAGMGWVICETRNCKRAICNTGCAVIPDWLAEISRRPSYRCAAIAPPPQMSVRPEYGRYVV